MHHITPDDIYLVITEDLINPDDQDVLLPVGSTLSLKEWLHLANLYGYDNCLAVVCTFKPTPTIPA